MMVLPTIAMAQVPHLTKLTDKYNGIDGVTAMTVNKQMIQMFASGDQTMEMVNEIVLLLSEDATTANNIIADAKKAIKKSKIEELITHNDDGATMTIYTNMKSDKVTDLVVLIENDSPSGFITINGEIPMEKLDEVVHIINK
jgi:hypothetical protein